MAWAHTASKDFKKIVDSSRVKFLLRQIGEFLNYSCSIFVLNHLFYETNIRVFEICYVIDTNWHDDRF